MSLTGDPIEIIPALKKEKNIYVYKATLEMSYLCGSLYYSELSHKRRHVYPFLTDIFSNFSNKQYFLKRDKIMTYNCTRIFYFIIDNTSVCFKML